MSRIFETYGDLSCGGIDVVPSKKKGEKFVYMNIHYYVTKPQLIKIIFFFESNNCNLRISQTIDWLLSFIKD